MASTVQQVQRPARFLDVLIPAIGFPLEGVAEPAAPAVCGYRDITHCGPEELRQRTAN
jgi:hypothetical protein